MAKPQQPTSQSSYVGQPVAIPGKMIFHDHPTPLDADRIYLVRRDRRKPDYEEPEHGAAYVGPEAEKFEGFFYVTWQPTDQIGWIDEIYLNERANQDEYNGEITYPYVDMHYPTITRTYVVLRGDQRADEPDADAVDPVYNDLVLTDHKIYRIQSGKYEYLDKMFVGVQRIYERLPGPVIATYQINGAQQVVTVDTQDVITEDVPALSPNALTEIAETKRVGTAKARVTVGVVEDVFDQLKYVVDRSEHAIPFKFRSAIPTVEVSQVLAGQATLPVLDAITWHAEDQNVTKYKHRIDSIVRNAAFPVALVNYKMTRDKQLETIVETMDNGVQAIAPGLLVVEDATDNLGNGQSIRTRGTVGNLFDPAEYSRTRPETWPERFRAGIPILTVVHAVPGTASIPTLAAGDVSRSEKQLDDYTKRTEISNRNVAVAPVLQGQEYDQTLDVIVPYIESISPVGTKLGQNRYEVTPLGDGNEEWKSFNIAQVQAALDNFIISFPGTANLQLPDILESVKGIIEENSGDGTYDEDGYALWTVSGSGGASSSLSIRGTGQASAAIIPDLDVQIRQIWANNVPTINYLFFLPMPVTSAQVASKLTALVGSSVLAWPHWNPIAHTITLVGQRLSLQCTAASTWQDGGSSSDSGSSYEHSQSGGTGYSQEVGLVLRTVRIPPTIHPAITLSGITGKQVNISADANANASSAEYIQKTGTVVGSITPTSLAATPGPTTIPTSGKYIKDVNAEPYRWGYAKIHAEVVDFASLANTTGGGDPTQNLHSVLYARFWVKPTATEIAGAGHMNYIHFANASVAKMGMGYNFGTNRWRLYQDGGALSEFSGTYVANAWRKIDIEIVSQVGAYDRMYLTIDNVPIGNLLLNTGSTISRIYFGAYQATSAVDHYLSSLTLGTTGYGSSNVFDGHTTSTIVPPFDSVAGTPTVPTSTLIYCNASGDLAIKSFTAITF